jgi:hypothetical protein
MTRMTAAEAWPLTFGAATTLSMNHRK